METGGIKARSENEAASSIPYPALPQKDCEEILRRWEAWPVWPPGSHRAAMAANQPRKPIRSPLRKRAPYGKETNRIYSEKVTNSTSRL